MHEEDSYLSMPQERDERWWRRVGSMFEHRAGSMFGQDSPIASSEAPAASHLPSQAGSGSRLTDVGDSGEALFDACTRGDLGDAERLLCDRADPCHRGEFGATPLLRAAEQGHVGLVSLLLSHGGRHDIQDDNNDTALLCACRMGHAGAISGENGQSTTAVAKLEAFRAAGCETAALVTEIGSAVGRALGGIQT